MKRKLIVLVVLLSILCASTAKGWTVFHHRSMTRDALKGIAEELGLTDDDLKLIASAAVDVDLYLGDPENTCHRVTTYRDKFNELNKKRKEKSGERSCEWQGAEWWAKAFIRRAKEELENGNRSEALRNLGYAIHYIQDAVNPPHVFPFKVETLTGPHLSFEMYAYRRYPEWQEKVRDAPEETPILGPEDLSIKLKEKADEVYNELRVKYIEEGDNNVCVSSQAALISSIKDCGTKGWEMPDEDIIRAMRIAAGLVKSAAKWVFLSKIYRDQYPNTIYQAPTVPPGTYSDHGGDPNDPRDCLAIQVSQGQRIILELTGPPGTDFDLRVYKPSNTSRASWESVKGNTSNERIVIDSAPETGRYVICISFASGSGMWSLTIKKEQGVLPNSTQQCPGITIERNIVSYADKDGKRNYEEKREGERNITTIVIHATDGNRLEGAIQKFRTRPDGECSPSTVENCYGKSAHYIVDKDGKIYLLVEEKDIAYHAGNYDVNKVSIGIEHVGVPSEEGWATEAMYQASAALVRCLMNRYPNITINRIIGHNQVPNPAPYPQKGWRCYSNYGGKECHYDPCAKQSWAFSGERCDKDYWDWTYYLKLVESGASLPPPPSQPPATPTLPPPKPPRKGATTASALVMDVSGSMGWTWQGEVKLESAKRVASQTISLIEGEARASGAGHSLAIVSFSDQANLLLPLTTDYRRAKGVVLTLSPQASTNLGAGLQMALAELAKAPAGSQKYITLLSDGHITSGMSEGEVLAGPVAQARQRKICIHTVGFGDPNYLKEDFLKMISQQSGCGKYLYAKNAFELANAYIKLRHLSLGGSIAEFISQAKIYEGETLTLGVVSLPGPRAGQEIEELHFTLTWSGSRLQPRLFDPAGVEVTEGYPGAQITYFEQFAHVVVRQPQPGFWKVVIFGEEVPPQGSDFYAVLSTRPGKLATIIPVINPVICFKYPSGEERCRYLLQGNIPTWRIIIGNIATLAVLAVIVAVVIYLRLSGQIP